MLTSRLTAQQMGDYDALKQFLLKEHRINPIQLRERFFSTRKASEETYASLASRLHTTLDFYIQSRHINKDYNALTDLLCLDRLKELLPGKGILDEGRRNCKCNGHLYGS